MTIAARIDQSSESLIDNSLATRSTTTTAYRPSNNLAYDRPSCRRADPCGVRAVAVLLTQTVRLLAQQRSMHEVGALVQWYPTKDRFTTQRLHVTKDYEGVAASW